MERHTVSTEELRDWLDHKQPVTVLDVRPVEERQEWSIPGIPGSTHVDAYDALRAGDAGALAGADLPDSDTPVVTVCGAGKTSLIAANQLSDRGFEAYSLEGGMKAWSLAWNTAELSLPGSTTRVIQVRRTGKGCLSYLVASDGEAGVIDASVDPQVYRRLADEHRCKITQVLDTHIHADHLSRSRALAGQTGARLFLPGQDRVAYEFTPLRDGDVLLIGKATLRTLHTPRHTAESVCYLLDDQVLFTGDTLFLRSIGRPDLKASADEARVRAGALHQSLTSLFELLRTTPGDFLVLPAHTSEPVPFDGRPIVAPLALVRQHLDILDLSEEAFTEEILSHIPPTPPNHERIVELNVAGILPASESNLTNLEAGANRCAIS